MITSELDSVVSTPASTGRVLEAESPAQLELVRLKVDVAAAVRLARNLLRGSPFALADEGLMIKTTLYHVFGSDLAPRPWTVVERPRTGQANPTLHIAGYSRSG